LYKNSAYFSALEKHKQLYNIKLASKVFYIAATSFGQKTYCCGFEADCPSPPSFLQETFLAWKHVA